MGYPNVLFQIQSAYHLLDIVTTRAAGGRAQDIRYNYISIVTAKPIIKYLMPTLN
jgi:hypothetical protein